jgi:hypothetical protein
MEINPLRPSRESQSTPRSGDCGETSFELKSGGFGSLSFKSVETKKAGRSPRGDRPAATGYRQKMKLLQLLNELPLVCTAWLLGAGSWWTVRRSS